MSPSFDPQRFYLGPLCRQGHAWQESGQSLRYVAHGQCRACRRRGSSAVPHVRAPLDRASLTLLLRDPILHARTERRLRSKLDKNDAQGCWLWTGSTDRSGYGTIAVTLDGCSCRITTHRLAYLLDRGSLPVLPLVVRHSVCGVRRCCNPLHLTEGSYRDNADDTARMKRIVRGAAHWTRCVTPDKLPRVQMNELEAMAALVLCAQGWEEHVVGALFGVRQQTIHELWAGHTWQHLAGPRRMSEGRARGEGHGNAKVTKGEVAELRGLRLEGWTLAALAARFGLSKSQIRRIIDGDSWAEEAAE